MSDSLKAEVVEGVEEPERSSALSRRDVVEEQISRIRDDLYHKTSANVLAMVDFARVEPDDEKPPEDWVDHFGERKAIEMMAIAKMARLPTKDAPYGLKVAHELFRGLEQARATDRLARSPNTVLVLVGEAPPALPSMPAPKAE